jgi:uncharacterized protein YjbJ (UPF0337 family)
MKETTKDEIRGKVLEFKGRAKEMAGRLSNDPDLEIEGQAEEVIGKVQQKVVQIQKVFGK